MADLRRLWFLIPAQYTTNYASAYRPWLSMASGTDNAYLQATKAVNNDLDDPMVTSGDLENPFYIYTDGITGVNGIFFESANWGESGYFLISYMENSIAADDRLVVSEVFGDALIHPLVDTDTIVNSSTGSGLIVYSGISSAAFSRVRFEAASPTAHLVLPNIWIGKVYEMDALYALGSTRNLEYLQRDSDKSASGVPITQQVSSASFGRTLRTWSLSFEWITETQLTALKDVFNACQGFRPFKMVSNTEIGFEHYAVAFSAPLGVTQVENGYYTVSVNLVEHN